TGAEGVAEARRWRALDDGMTDERRLQANVGEERRLERQQTQHVIEIRRHFLRAVGTRRPHLRRGVGNGVEVGSGRSYGCGVTRWGGSVRMRLATRCVKSGLSMVTTMSGCVLTAKSAAWRTRARMRRTRGATSRRPITDVSSSEKRLCRPAARICWPPTPTMR